jgi:hypothetical protein
MRLERKAVCCLEGGADARIDAHDGDLGDE